MQSNGTAIWVATLSNGKTFTEHDFEVKPGERKPWVQLTRYLGENKLFLTSLRLNFRGRTIHLPRANFDRFDLNEVNRAPLFYSLCYHVEGDIDLSIGQMVQSDFIELSSHYDNFVVSYIQDLSNESNSWIIVTDDRRGLAETPRRK